ncbi:MAG: hypothetical protein JWP08_3886 [Bryobacterales bacterium]|nr:hypothetical protein [Bryobacterales bacterium]
MTFGIFNPGWRAGNGVSAGLRSFVRTGLHNALAREKRV